MKTRIGLFTPKQRARKKGEATTTVSYVEFETAADLAAKLEELGAKQVTLLRRDRLGVTHPEGAKFPSAGLNADHVKWLTAKTKEFETRGLYYETS
jgi:uncharacterized ferredoxin-like protein